MITMVSVREPHQTDVRSPPVAGRPSPVPLGPPWWGAVMGTGIIGTLTQLHVGSTVVGADLARFFLVAGWTLMLVFAATFAVRCARDADVGRRSITGVGAASWGMVSMGILALGATTSTVLPHWTPGLTQAAWWADGALWVVGTVIGLLSTFGFTLALLRNRPENPRPAWGLAIVPPMVSATCGTPFVARIDSPHLSFALLILLLACFVCSLTLGVVIFTAAYHHLLRIDPLPLALAASSWIPLGVVGQSTAAAQAIAAQAPRFLLPDAADGARLVADVYGCVMLTVAVPLVGFAVRTTIHGAVNRMPFSPGWWALTFPLGTLSLGALRLGESTTLTGYSVASTITWVALLGTWTLCAGASFLSAVGPVLRSRSGSRFAGRV